MQLIDYRNFVIYFKVHSHNFLLCMGHALAKMSKWASLKVASFMRPAALKYGHILSPQKLYCNILNRH